MKSGSTTDIGRRAFLERAAWAVTAAAIGGAAKAAPAPGEASLVGFVAPKLEKIRVGVIGIGGRGSGAVRRLCKVPGLEITAVCDLIEDRAKKGQDIVKKAGFREPKAFVGPEGYKRLCESGLVDAVHINTNWTSHAEIALYSLKCAIHTFVEVPGVRSIDEAWAVVETAEKNRCHCMMRSNCCYDEDAMTLINAAHAGILGELMHGGMDYLMDFRWSHCIRNGFPLDMSVYDFATWSSIFELSERSVRNRSQAQDIPDFTRGAWKTTPPDTAPLT